MLDILVLLMGFLFLASGLAAVAPMENLRRKAQQTLEIDRDFKRQAVHKTLVWGIRSGIFWALMFFLMPWIISDTPSPTFATVLMLVIVALVTGAFWALFLWGNAHLIAYYLEKGWIPIWRKREVCRTPLPEEKTQTRTQEPVDWT